MKSIFGERAFSEEYVWCLTLSFCYCTVRAYLKTNADGLENKYIHEQ